MRFGKDHRTLGMFDEAPPVLRQPEDKTFDSLRWYQQDAVVDIEASLEQVRSTMLTLATGLGKTQCFSALAHRWKKGRVLVLAHREELVDQARARLEQMTGELVEVEKAELRSHKARIVVGSVQTVYREDRLARLQKNGGFGLVIVDECHHYVSDTYQLPLEYFAGAKILGVTATPDRADGKALGKIFDDVAYSMDLRDGIEHGYLVPLKGKEVEVQEINLDRVASANGDLNQTQLDEAMLAGVEGIVKGMLHHSGERQGLIFFPGVHGAYLAAERLNALKANSAVAVSGETPKDERRRLMDAFRHGDIQFLANCMVATEGFDAPTASVVGLARPTKSRSLYAQMVGRGTRVLPGVVDHIKGRDQGPERRAAIAASKKPGCLLIDFVGNNSRHTLMTPQDLLGGMYSEEVRKKARKDGDDEDVQEALERAAEDERKELARKDMMAAAMSITSHVKSVSRDYDPFRLLGVNIEREHKYGTEYGYKPMSDKQKALMLRQGFAEKEMEGMSARTATKVISQIVERQKRGLSSPKQNQVLGRVGIVDQNIKAKTASLLISHIVNTNGKIDPQVVRDLTSNEEF